MTINESEFWLRLEFRLGSEFAGMRNNHLRFLWCDGFTPQRYALDDDPLCITGQVWICSGQRQEEWEFTLFLPPALRSQGGIDWTTLLPPENVTRWLAIDLRGKRIQIEPAAAVTDLDEW